MALDRKYQKIFAKNAQSTDLGVVGSKMAGNEQYSTDIEILQSLSNWETGLRSQVSNSNAPYLQDQNSILYVITSQLAYLFQAGIAEWNSQTEYFSGKSVVLRSGKLYIAIANSTGVEPEVTTGWANSWICINYWGGLQGSIANQRDLTALVSGGYFASCTSNKTSAQKDIVLSDSIPLGAGNTIPDGTRIRVRFTKGSKVLIYDPNNPSVRPYLSMYVSGVSLMANIYINGYVDADSVGAKFYCSPNEIVEFTFYNGNAYCDNVISYTQRAILTPTDKEHISIRIWRDGWCEQRGVKDYGSNARSLQTTVSFAETLQDVCYSFNFTTAREGSGDIAGAIGTRNKTTSSIDVSFYGNSSGDLARYIMWNVEGYIE